jgi:hypothetical protein
MVTRFACKLVSSNKETSAASCNAKMEEDENDDYVLCAFGVSVPVCLHTNGYHCHKLSREKIEKFIKEIYKIVLKYKESVFDVGFWYE